MRSGEPGYLSHEELRRWNAAAPLGIIGIVFQQDPEDTDRLSRAVSRLMLSPLASEDEDSEVEQSPNFVEKMGRDNEEDDDQNGAIGGQAAAPIAAQ